MKKYFIKYTFEFLVIVMGITVSFWLNNWNESIKETTIEKDLVNLLISDLENKKKENISDVKIFNNGIKRFTQVINTWETTKEIDTTDLKPMLNYLGMDIVKFNEKSPIYSSLSNTKLWDNLPNDLVDDVNQLYRNSYAGLKLEFEKISESNTYCKLHFLLPNDLIDLERETSVIYKIVQNVDKEYVLYIKLILNSVQKIKSTTEGIIYETENLIGNLKNYNKLNHQ